MAAPEDFADAAEAWDAIVACRDLPQLDAIGQAIARAVKAGDIGPADTTHLRERFAARRLSLAFEKRRRET